VRKGHTTKTGPKKVSITGSDTKNLGPLQRSLRTGGKAQIKNKGEKGKERIFRAHRYDRKEAAREYRTGFEKMEQKAG